MQVGQEVRFTRTIGEADIHLFAGLTGDNARNHMDEAFMAASPYGRRIAHGALLIGFMSRASTMISGADRIDIDPASVPVSAGFDRIRFTGPAFIGDTITVSYRITSVDGPRIAADIEIVTQDGRTVAVARHLLRFVGHSK